MLPLITRSAEITGVEPDKNALYIYKQKFVYDNDTYLYINFNEH